MIFCAFKYRADSFSNLGKALSVSEKLAKIYLERRLLEILHFLRQNSTKNSIDHKDETREGNAERIMRKRVALKWISPGLIRGY